jgi:hypothetical protein
MVILGVIPVGFSKNTQSWFFFVFFPFLKFLMEMSAGYTHQVSGDVMPLGSKLSQIHAHPW